MPREGEYILRARAYGEQAGPEPARMAFLIDNQEVMRFDVPVMQNRPRVYKMRLPMRPGKHKFSAAYLNNYNNPKDPPRWRDRNLVIDYLEVISPAATKPIATPESHKRIFVHEPKPGTEREAAREIVSNFARRAFRRPVKSDEVDRLLKFFEMGYTGGENFQTSIKLALEAVLVSPQFLFRGELQPDPNNPKSVHAVDEFALATRLSYFLWSSMPDEELFAQAQLGTLRKNLDAQVKRMLKDPKSHALVENFAGQWLQIRNLSQASPAREKYPKFDDQLREAMQRETEMFFENIVREDRSVLEFLDSDYTFVNERLAEALRHRGHQRRPIPEGLIEGDATGWSFDTRKYPNDYVESDPNIACETGQMGVGKHSRNTTAAPTARCARIEGGTGSERNVAGTDGAAPGESPLRLVPSKDGPDRVWF